ncbi:hypothetical protein CRI94_17340 [Longibacter salinarum]|uniref:FecR protein domain-containing protein n=1 Tax=Longibacter salinarum TaxID=1850348 RepID=A0A2A8CT41_9BACT|nr:hypothetical protein [Longibacter salinarum]PEN10381.1 hypothetical protein CRI94_17340 [Longibacter salinarum]
MNQTIQFWRLPVVLLIGLMAAGCATQSPGHITKTESKVTGEQAVQMSPGFIGDDLRMGLVYGPSVSKDSVLVTAGVNEIATIASGQSLLIRVDETVYRFRSSTTTRVKPGDPSIENNIFADGERLSQRSFSSKNYLLPVSLLKDMVRSDTCFVQVRTTEGYVEGDFHDGGNASAKKGVREFLGTIEQ